MTNNKTKFTYIAVAILLVIAATAGTIFALQLLGNNKDNSSKDATPKLTRPARTEAETKVDKVKDQAAQALQNNELDKAKELFQEAKKQYEDLGDMENAGDVDGQLAIVNQLSEPPAAAPPIAPGAGQ